VEVCVPAELFALVSSSPGRMLDDLKRRSVVDTRACARALTTYANANAGAEGKQRSRTAELGGVDASRTTTSTTADRHHDEEISLELPTNSTARPQSKHRGYSQMQEAVELSSVQEAVELSSVPGQNSDFSPSFAVAVQLRRYGVLPVGCACTVLFLAGAFFALAAFHAFTYATPGTRTATPLPLPSVLPPSPAPAPPPPSASPPPPSTPPSPAPQLPPPPPQPPPPPDCPPLVDAPSSVCAEVANGFARAASFNAFDLSAAIWQERALVSGLAAMTSQEVMVCASSSAFFYHVYKSAGSTFTDIMRDYCPRQASVCFSAHPGYFDGRQHDHVCGWHGTPVELDGRALFAEREPPAVSDARREPSALYFTVVRDPLSRVVSALHELSRRKHYGWAQYNDRWEPPLRRTSVSELVESIHSRGFWNAHFQPQYWFMLQQNATKVPLNYVALMGPHLDTTIKYVLQRLKHPHGAFAWRDVPVPRRSNPTTNAEVVFPSREEVRSVCRWHALTPSRSVPAVSLACRLISLFAARAGCIAPTTSRSVSTSQRNAETSFESSNEGDRNMPPSWFGSGPLSPSSASALLTTPHGSTHSPSLSPHPLAPPLCVCGENYLTLVLTLLTLAPVSSPHSPPSLPSPAFVVFFFARTSWFLGAPLVVLRTLRSATGGASEWRPPLAWCVEASPKSPRHYRRPPSTPRAGPAGPRHARQLLARFAQGHSPWASCCGNHLKASAHAPAMD